jgi:hypothetical protein
MPTRQPCGSRDILKDDRTALHKTTGSDRAVLIVELSLLRPCVRHTEALGRL